MESGLANIFANLSTGRPVRCCRESWLSTSNVAFGYEIMYWLFHSVRRRAYVFINVDLVVGSNRCPSFVNHHSLIESFAAASGYDIVDEDVLNTHRPRV
jgi:hypothetical protein